MDIWLYKNRLRLLLQHLVGSAILWSGEWLVRKFWTQRRAVGWSHLLFVSVGIGPLGGIVRSHSVILTVAVKRGTFVLVEWVSPLGLGEDFELMSVA
jgi:hypothetical protein